MNNVTNFLEENHNPNYTPMRTGQFLELTTTEYNDHQFFDTQHDMILK